MDIKSYFAEKLSEFLFLEISRENVEKIFKVKIPQGIYLPVNSKYIVEDVKSEKNMENIPPSSGHNRLSAFWSFWIHKTRKHQDT